MGILCSRHGTVVIIQQHGPVVRMGTVIDNLQRTGMGCQAAQVSNALLGDDDINIMLRVVDVRAHRHHRGYLAVLRNRGCVEDGQEGVAGEVAAAADAVHRRKYPPR